MLVERRLPDDDRLPEPGLQLGLREPLPVGTEVEELERVGRPDVRRLLVEAAGIGEIRDSLARRHREAVAALRAHAQGHAQLLVAEARVARGARVRVALPLDRLWLVLPLDRDVDAAFGHQMADYRPAFKASTRAAASCTRCRNDAECRAFASRCR